MNYQIILNNIDRFNKNTETYLTGSNKLRTWISELYCFARFGCSPDDYFRYGFYKKSDYERDTFITYRRSQYLIKHCNDAAYTKYFYNKKLFNEKFSPFLGREWMDLNMASKEELESFVHNKKDGQVILKPSSGGQGKGIYKLKASELIEFSIDEHRDYIAEEMIIQHPLMNSLNPTSVNTIRVLTFKGEILACALRIGNAESLVDNLNSGGLCAHLDLTTGMIDSPCINKKLEKFLCHPDSKMQLVGFRVPNWEAVIETAKEAAMVVPEVQYVGWDIAVTKNGTALIEGNHDPGHSTVQMVTQKGLYNRVRKQND